MRAVSAALSVRPGELLVVRSAEVLHAELDACVGVCLWAAEPGVGGLCHYLLPEAPESAGRDLRYGDRAIASLVDWVSALKSRTSPLRAALFGGAAAPRGSARWGVGVRNVERARAELARLRIPLVAEDVGGTRGRRLRFSPRTGETHVVRV